MHSASNWQELHDTAIEHGLQVRRHGARLVIGNLDLDLRARCNNVGRDPSSKALTDRPGLFQPSQQQAKAKAVHRHYEPKPRRPDRPGTSALFAQYQRERQAAIVGRCYGFNAIRRDSALTSAQLCNRQQTQRVLVKVATKGAAKRVMMATIKQQVDATHNANRQDANTRRETLFKQTVMPSWTD